MPDEVASGFGISRPLWPKIRAAFTEAFVAADGQVRDAAGHLPSAIGSFPGTGDTEEAVFQVGSGAHEFSGPAPSHPGYSRRKR